MPGAPIPQNFRFYFRLGLVLIVALALFAPGMAIVALVVAVSEINPNRSTLGSGGRINGLAADPTSAQIFYASSEWGGLFKSIDAGQTWFRLNRHLPSVTWDVEVDPSNADRIFATSYYDGRVDSLAGINLCTDGGFTWVHPASASPPVGFCAQQARREAPSAFGISIDPASPQNLYVGTNCGLAVSSDSGATWNYLDPTPDDGADNVWDVVVHDGGIIDLCGDDGHQRSTEGGLTWTTSSSLPRPGGRLCSISVSPDEPYVVFVVAGLTIFVSDDADQPGPAKEDLYFGNQDTGAFATTNAPTPSPAWSNPGGADSWNVAADPDRVLYTICCYAGGRLNRVYVRNPGMTGGNELSNYPSGRVKSGPMDVIDNFGPDDYVIMTTEGIFVIPDIAATPAVDWTPLGAATAPVLACGIQAAVRQALL